MGVEGCLTDKRIISSFLGPVHDVLMSRRRLMSHGCDNDVAVCTREVVLSCKEGDTKLGNDHLLSLCNLTP